MNDKVYVNGDYCTKQSAKISVFDRAFLFSDAVYEVTTVINGKLVDFDSHFKRLERSLESLSIPLPFDYSTALSVHREIVAHNKVGNGMVYMQVSRGNPEFRDFAWSATSDYSPSIVVFSQNKSDIVDNSLAKSGMKVISLEDLRWGRCDIKTTQLLFACMAKEEAISQGANDAWFVKNDFITEGTSNNAYIVKQDKIITRNLSSDILGGITRESVLAIASKLSLEVQIRPFAINEVYSADEAFITSATTFVLPVVEFNSRKISNGIPGVITKLVREKYIENAIASAI